MDREQVRIFEKRGFEPIHLTYTFESFEVNKQNKNNYDACKSFVVKPFNLYVYGSAGNGKTRLAVTAIKERLLANFNTEYGKIVSWDDFKNNVMADMRNDSSSYVDNLASYKCLLIDDIFRNGVNETTKAAIIRLFDKWGNRGKKGLIVTGNMDIEKLSQILEDDRAVSRTAGLFDLIIENSGDDYRVKNLKEKTIKAGQDFHAKAAGLGLLKTN